MFRLAKTISFEFGFGIWFFRVLGLSLDWYLFFLGFRVWVEIQTQTQNPSFFWVKRLDSHMNINASNHLSSHRIIYSES